MAAAGVTLAGLGALVGLAIGSGDGPKLVAQRTPPVEVRTQVIRRTINVYRREHPHHVSGTGPGGVPSGTSLGGSSAATPAIARTRSSGARAAAPAASAAPVVTTRSSGSKPASGSTSPAGSGSQTVRTRSSGASSPGSGSSHAVSTRSSGGGDGEGKGGGHGD
ncbi:MAG: hypothetical protein ACHQAV_01395 [Solirubrobacterales bacterium]